MCGRIVLEQLNKIYEVYTSEKPKYIIEVQYNLLLKKYKRIEWDLLNVATF